MLDVARLVRTGKDETAEVAHAVATRLASHRAARFVAEWLANDGGPDPDPALLDAETSGALTRLATLTGSARRKLPRLGVERFAGRVAEVSGRVGLVLDENGHSLPIPALAESPIE